MRTALLVSFALCLAAIAMATVPRPDQDRPALASNLPFRPAVVSGDFIYLAGTLATDERMQLVPGDIKAQATRVIANLRRTLEEAGSSLDRVAAVQVYLKRASDFQAMNEAYRAAWPKDPPVRTTVVTNLVMPEALVEMSMIAVRKGVERTVVQPAGWSTSPNPYSYGITSGDTLFLAGLIARNPKDNVPLRGDITTQTKAVLDNAGAILKAAGMTYADVVSSRVYITDTATFQDMNAAYRQYFPKDPPARATVKAGLTAPDYAIEITMTAVKAADRVAIVAPNADGSPGRPNPVLSSAIRAGNRLYLSGTLGNTGANKGDIKAQTRETLARLGRTLQAAGFTWSHVVDGIVYLTDAANFAGMNEVYRSIVPQPYPARATVEAGLVSPDGLVEIMVTAAK